MPYRDHDVKKISPGIGVMKQVRHVIRQANLHLIYRALRLSLFIYCSTVTGFVSCGIKKQTSKTANLNRAARVITLI